MATMRKGMSMDRESAKDTAVPDGTVTYTAAFIRTISKRVAHLLTRTNLVPNHITLASFVLSLLSVVFFLSGTWTHSLIAALLLNLSLVLDYVDGDLARAKSLSSRSGALLDEFTDKLGHIVIIGAITWAAYRGNPSAYVWLVGFAALGGPFLVGFTGMKVRQLRRDSKVPIDMKALKRDIKFRRLFISGSDVHVLFITISAILDHLLLGLVLIACSSFADSAVRFMTNYRSFQSGDRHANYES
jgi:phosphatidylglycerophosphate synthase